MDEHKKYLADRLLSEQQPITYRLLSRALDVHVNTAKQMLFDFHRHQNKIKPSSVHATYILYGIETRHPARHQDGDIEMSSSMPDSSMPEPVRLSEDAPLAIMTLVAEENLEARLTEYEQIMSVHMYSLAPHPQRELGILSELSDSMMDYSAKEDAVAAAKKYGTIANPQMHRRNRRGPPPANAAPAQARPPQVKPPIKQEQPAPAQVANVKDETAEPSKLAPASNQATNTKKSAPSLKRGGSGGIMQSFAKAADRPPKPKKTAAKEEAAALSDDGEADDSDLPAPKMAEVESDAVRKSRKEREEELRRMMDDDEEDEENEEEKEEESEQEDEEMEEPPVESPKSKEPEEPSEVVASAGDGRRRGKRKVMKKKRVVDDQGYMVTIQEQGWESFSEDEAPPPAKKPATAVAPASAPKLKKPAGKGQGNIMSFFGKK